MYMDMLYNSIQEFVINKHLNMQVLVTLYIFLFMLHNCKAFISQFCSLYILILYPPALKDNIVYRLMIIFLKIKFSEKLHALASIRRHLSSELRKV